MATYEIFAIGADGRRIQQITSFKRGEFISNMNNIGTWLMEFDSQIADMDIFEWQGGIAVYRNGSVYYKGRTVSIEDIDTDLPTGSLIVWGTDYLGYLDTRIVPPVPLGPPYTSSQYSSKSGAACDIIKAYMRDNIGSLAKVSRLINPLTVALDDGLGGATFGKARFDNLLELVADIAVRGGDVGFRFIGNDFRTYIPVDKTAAVVFSRDRGNLKRYSRKVTMPEANYIVAGGTGEGVARDFQEAGNQESINIYGRLEWFYDYRNASSSELYDAMAGKLDEMSDKLSISLELADTDGSRWLTDYQLGDKVTVKLPNQTYAEKIRAEKLTLDAKGDHVQITIGTPGTKAQGKMPAIGKLYDKDRQSEKRILNMERR